MAQSKLVKLLAMVFAGSNDNEVLAAVRRSKSQMERDGVDIHDVLGGGAKGDNLKTILLQGQVDRLNQQLAEVEAKHVAELAALQRKADKIIEQRVAEAVAARQERFNDRARDLKRLTDENAELRGQIAAMEAMGMGKGEQQSAPEPEQPATDKAARIAALEAEKVNCFDMDRFFAILEELEALSK